MKNSISNINEYIGMHIRMEGGEKYQSIEAEREEHLSRNGKENMFKYRELSHIDNFINQINNILHKNPQQKFYIATDMKINYEELIRIYGNDTINCLHRHLFDRSLEQKYYAVARSSEINLSETFTNENWEPRLFESILKEFKL